MTPEPAAEPAPEPLAGQPHGFGLLDIVVPCWHARWRLLATVLLAAALAFAASLPRTPHYTGRASFVVPAPQRPSLAAVASAFPGLAGLGGGGQQADLHVAMLRSQTVSDRILDRFQLQTSWGQRWRTDARRMLAQRVVFAIGRRDAVVRIEAEDENPHRAAAIANQYVEELRELLHRFALDEARDRRFFYDAQLARAREQLATAQQKLLQSGYGGAALRADARAPAEGWVRLQAEITAAEVRLAALRRSRTDESAEVQRQLAELSTLRSRLAGLEQPRDEGGGDFVGRTRDYRYAEALVDSISRQAEAARVDEAADAVPVQWLDRALPPEWPSSPHRIGWMLNGALLALLLHMALVVGRHRLALARQDPAHQQRLQRLRSALPQRRRWWRRKRPQ